MKKLIALDIDGTTIRSDQTLSKNTVDILKSLVHYDVEWMFVTGRNYDLVRPILDQYGLECDLILNNGNEYRQQGSTPPVFHGMNFDFFSFVITILLKYDFNISIHTSNGKYILEDYDVYFKRHLDLFTLPLNLFDTLKDTPIFNRDFFLKNTTYIQDFHELKNVDILKIDAKIGDIDLMNKAILELETSLDIEMSSSFGQFIEICQKGYDKGRKLKEVAALKGYKDNQVFVFGDGLNDLGMFTQFENSFAPKDAKEAILNRASHIMATADEDGVYHTIQHLLMTDFLLK